MPGLLLLCVKPGDTSCNVQLSRPHKQRATEFLLTAFLHLQCDLFSRFGFSAENHDRFIIFGTEREFSNYIHSNFQNETAIKGVTQIHVVSVN